MILIKKNAKGFEIVTLIYLQISELFVHPCVDFVPLEISQLPKTVLKGKNTKNKQRGIIENKFEVYPDKTQIPYGVWNT